MTLRQNIWEILEKKGICYGISHNHIFCYKNLITIYQLQVAHNEFIDIK